MNEATDNPMARPKRAQKAPLPADSQPGTEEAETFPPDEVILERLDRGAKYCQEVEQQLSKWATPDLETIMKLHRILILKLSTVADVRPELWNVLKDLMKPVIDWARLQEQRKEREFAEQKYRDQVAAAAAGKENENRRPEDTTLSPVTVAKIESELKLL